MLGQACVPRHGSASLSRSVSKAGSHGGRGWGVPPLLLPGKLQARSDGFDLFPIVSYGKGAKLRAECKNKTKDLTLGGKMPIPRGEMWYSPACPLSALQDPLPAALHSSVSSLKPELQESANAGHAAPAALLVLPVKAMLRHHQSSATRRGWCLPRRQHWDFSFHRTKLYCLQGDIMSQMAKEKALVFFFFFSSYFSLSFWMIFQETLLSLWSTSVW